MNVIAALAAKIDLILDPPAERREIGACALCSTMLTAGSRDQWTTCPVCGREDRVSTVKLRRLKTLCYDDSKISTAGEVAAARFEPVGLDVGFDQFVPMVPHPSFGLFFVQSLRHMDRESPPPMIGYSKPANSENSTCASPFTRRFCTELYRTVPDRPRPSGSDRSEFHTIKSANVLPRVSVSFPGLSWSMRMPSTVQPSGMRVGS